MTKRSFYKSANLSRLSSTVNAMSTETYDTSKTVCRLII